MGGARTARAVSTGEDATATPVDASGAASARYTRESGAALTAEPVSPRQRKGAPPLPPLARFGDVPRPRRDPLTSDYAKSLNEVRVPQRISDAERDDPKLGTTGRA